MLNAIKRLLMTIFVILTCFLGVAAAAAEAPVASEDDDNEEIEFLEVFEGGNLTISIQIERAEKEPQVLVSQIRSSSSDLIIAQLTCHRDVECTRQCWVSGGSLMFDGENMTLTLMNFTYSKAGLYKVCKISSTPLESKIYNISVFRKEHTESAISTMSPAQSASAIHSEGIIAAISGTAVVVMLLVISAIICVFKKQQGTNKEFINVPKHDDNMETFL